MGIDCGGLSKACSAAAGGPKAEAGIGFGGGQRVPSLSAMGLRSAVSSHSWVRGTGAQPRLPNGLSIF